MHKQKNSDFFFKKCVPTLPKIFRPLPETCRNTLIFNLANRRLVAGAHQFKLYFILFPEMLCKVFIKILEKNLLFRSAVS